MLTGKGYVITVCYCVTCQQKVASLQLHSGWAYKDYIICPSPSSLFFLFLKNQCSIGRWTQSLCSTEQKESHFTYQVTGVRRVYQQDYDEVFVVFRMKLLRDILDRSAVRKHRNITIVLLCRHTVDEHSGAN